MDKDSDLREGLLRQMDLDGRGARGASQEAARSILAADAARLRRLKRITVFSWGLLAVAFLASGIVGALTGFRNEAWAIASIIGLQALLILDVSLTFAWLVRARTLRMKEIQEALAEIQDQLRALSRQEPAGR